MYILRSRGVKFKNKKKAKQLLLKNTITNLSLTHYVENQNCIPLWVLVNLMSFGDISKFYACMKQSEQSEVAKRLKWGLRENYLVNFLNFLSAIRNRCAHSERLYSYECYVSLLNDNNIFKYFRYKSTKPKLTHL